MAPQRSASAPLPPFCSYLAKRGRVASAYVLRNVHTDNPIPTPPPAASRPPPPTPGGGLNTLQIRSANVPTPTPAPCSLRSLPPSRSRRGALITFAIPSTMAIPSHVPTLPPLAPPVLAPRAWALGAVRPTARCPPRRPGGL